MGADIAGGVGICTIADSQRLPEHCRVQTSADR